MRGRLLCVLFMLWIPLVTPSSEKTTAVFGHKIPDTDAICGALAYTWELNARNISATAYRLGELNPETQYVLKTLGLEAPPLLTELDLSSPVAIVDTNNPAELPDGIEKAHIHSIIDHHKLSGLTTSEPLEIDLRPLCSTGSILYSRAKASGRVPPKAVAGLMLSSILSDSLEFRSPTTTQTDRIYADELSQLADLDVHSYAEAMLDAKAQIGHLSPEELVMMDSKVFTIGGKKLRISVLELTKPEPALRQHKNLVAAQRKLAIEQKIDDVLVFVVDVLNEEATFISASPNSSRLVEHAWPVTVNDEGMAVLPGVLSRKKQIVPALMKAVVSDEL